MSFASESPWREAVESRMLRIALGNSKRISGYWDPQQRDCAGFVRFLYREALSGNAELWTNREAKKVSYVGADELVAYNFEFLSSNVHDPNLRTGDLFVYYSDKKMIGDSWHLMVLLKGQNEVSERAMLAYHSGAADESETLKKVWLKDLESTSVTEWRPQIQNPSFRGVYRWKGWKNGPRKHLFKSGAVK